MRNESKQMRSSTTKNRPKIKNAKIAKSRPLPVSIQQPSSSLVAGTEQVGGTEQLVQVTENVAEIEELASVAASEPVNLVRSARMEPVAETSAQSKPWISS
ncbi:hypothetical protein O0L34_g9233 [Tuta absoluta]|nr:hypothetical protein O0L34_g9233 [Tuta absoluta]